MVAQRFKRLKAHKHTLHLLKNSNKKTREQLITSGSNDLIKSLCEVTQNTLNGNNKLSKNCLGRLLCYKTPMRKIIDPKRSLSSKRKVLVQKGGFIPIILGALLSGIVGKILDRVST